MSRVNVDEPHEHLTFEPEEEAWFNAYENKQKPPHRASPRPPPTPIGDPLADKWFR